MNDLSAFVPRLAAELATDQGSTWTKVDGSMLSADISGFTALSEKLAGKGKAGAEEITELINTCFTALIDAAYGYGGEIIKFGGDALLVLFRGDQHQHRSANASLAMQIALHSSPAAKRANLTMTVGASHGPFDVFLAGSDYRELLIIGPAASQVIHLEGEADKGETLVSHEIASTLPIGMTGREHAGGVAISGAPVDPPSPPEARLHGDARMEAFVPPQVNEQLSAFSELGGEHRLVSVGFVMVGGIEASLGDDGPAATATALGRLVDDVIAAARPYGVTALHTDIAPDGFKFVLCAGAPVNPGDISDALLQSALDIARIDSRFTLRQGTQTGRVFAGFLGASYRRTYTLMGDPVNTAARMLGKAGDRDVVAVGTMFEDTRAVFEGEQLEPFLVKGKTEPIIAYRVTGVTDAVRRDGAHTRLFGRSAELEVLSRAIGELGEIIDIVGPAGVGKSRLLDAAWDEAEGLVHQHGSCTPYGATSPYSVFRPLLRGAIGIDPKATPAEAGQQLTAFVHLRAPNMATRLPLLAVPFGAEVASTPEVDAIDPEFRRASIHEAIVDLYDTTLGERPVFLVIEDLHWVDDASGELVDHLVRAAATRKWAGVTTRRPEGSWKMNSALPHVTTIDLEPLTDHDIRGVAIEASTQPLGDATLDLIAERSQGNPLFALELTRAAAGGGASELPDSVEKVISSRIDGLPPGLRRLIRVASVFGNSFDTDDLAPVLDQVGATTSIDDPGLSEMLEHRSGSTWAFRHALYRDASYEGLPYRQRRQLHAAVADSLEQRASDPTAIAALLSLHFHNAHDKQKTWQYSLIAGQVAEAQYSLSEAAATYERALDASVGLKTLDNEQRAEVATALGDALVALGRYEDAERVYRRARGYNVDAIRSIDLMRKLGVLHERAGDLTNAIRWFGRARREAQALPRHRDVRIAQAQVDLADAGVRFRRGEYRRCREIAGEALRRAADTGDRRTEALALDRLHVSTVYLHEPDAERFGPRAVDAFEELGDLASKSRVLNNLGIEAYFNGRWTEAATFYEASMRDGIAAGSVIEASLAALNSGEILSDQGHWTVALERLRDALRNWEAAGYATGIAAANLFIGVTQFRQGEHAQARASFEEAAERLDELGLEELVDDAASWLVGLDVLEGIAGPTETEALLNRLGTGHRLRSRVLRTHARALHQADRGDEAIALLRTEVEASDSFERARLLHLLSALDPEAPEIDEWQREADEIHDRLGIVAAPDPLGRVSV